MDMEAKPLVTCHGNQTLFSSLHSTVLHGLPKEATEWRRSYGRPPRNVNLEASFVPYDDDILPTETDKTLVSRPYFHIYWTDCDMESYKQTVREEIVEWTTALKNSNIPDWLIVVVVNDESKVKTKLLPRSSVIDKIKNDFCSKQTDRCVVLTDPLKADQKSTESWLSFHSRLRQLLIQAFTRHLARYEDNMRALREKRSEDGWNFQEYFLVQEELAFMFEMLGLYEDALIQYDELDALFTQFVVNHASGAPVAWLKNLTQPCTCWAGLSLYKAIDHDKRDLVKDNKASLLEFRNYLFSRQCALLVRMSRASELAKRAMAFLHNTLQEIKTLRVSTPEGSTDCWVFLSGLEVLQHCQKKFTGTNQAKTYSIYTASLWDYVRRKLWDIGTLCGLTPESSGPMSEQLSLVIDLTSGMGLAADADIVFDQPVPRDKLREALSSRESFQKIYLEQSELAMGTFKHIGRFRCARMIGKDLADFYMKLHQPEKAESFLVDCMKSYEQEGWKSLSDDVRLTLAQCRYQTGNTLKYLKTACHVAGSHILKESDRRTHMNNILSTQPEIKGTPIYLKAAPVLHLEVLGFKEDSLVVDEEMEMTVLVFNNSPIDLKCNELWVSFESFPGGDTRDKTVKPVQMELSRMGSDSSLDKKFVANFQPVRKQIPSLIKMQTSLEEKEGGSICGVTCINSHELLKRTDSSGVTKVQEREPTINDRVSRVVVLTDVELKPGGNTLCLKDSLIGAGHWRPSQAGFKIEQLEFLQAVSTERYICVSKDEPYCTIQPDSVFYGLNQEVTVTLHTGSYKIPEGSHVKVSSPTGVVVAVGNNDNMVDVEATPHGSTTMWHMTVYCEAVATGIAKQQQIKFDCSWLKSSILTSVDFLQPFTVSHKLYTCKTQKYIQVMVQGNSEKGFLLTQFDLVAINTQDVELVKLNKAEQKLQINKDQSCFCMWLVKSNVPELPALELEYSAQYQCSDKDSPSQILIYSFSIENYQCALEFRAWITVAILNLAHSKLQRKIPIDDYQTLLTVNVEVCPSEEAKVCKTGTLARLQMCVSMLDQQQSVGVSDMQQLLYEINLDTTLWAMYGKTTGVCKLDDGKCEVHLQIMPLTVGFLPLPKVLLYKCAEIQDDETKEADDDDDDDDDIPEDASGVYEQIPETPSFQKVPFDTGQIYYSSMGKQVHVYPESASADIEITVI